MHFQSSILNQVACLEGTRATEVPDNACLRISWECTYMTGPDGGSLWQVCPLVHELFLKNMVHWYLRNESLQANKPSRWKSMLTHQGWLNLLIYATFTCSTNYRVCNLHIYLYLAPPVTLLPPVRSISGKACSPTKGGLFCLYMQPLLAPQTTEFVICISIYIMRHALTPPGTLDLTRKV